MTFKNYCRLVSIEDFESRFELEKYELENNCKTNTFLQKELQKSRFDFSSVAINYQTLAELEGLTSTEISKFWVVIEPRLVDFPFTDVDYNELRRALSKICNNNNVIDIALNSLDRLVTRTKEIILANFEGLKYSRQKQMGFLGELIPYLCERDIKTANCIFSKIIPDNPIMFRHGMDLLSIHFSDNESDDVVCFWEVKSTINNFSDRCKEIIDWFNKDSESHLTMVIEAAKLDWKDKLSNTNFVRASSVLSKFLFAKTNYEYTGSIILDSAGYPDQIKIRKFDDVDVPKENKRLVLFNINDFNCIIDEVYDEL